MISFHRWPDIPMNFEGHCYIRSGSYECWLIKNRLSHRLDGPAYEYSSGKKSYYIFGDYIEEQNYWNHHLVIQNKLHSILSIDT